MKVPTAADLQAGAVPVGPVRRRKAAAPVFWLFGIYRAWELFGFFFLS